MAKDKAKNSKPRKQYSKDDAGKAERFRDFAAARVTRAMKAMRAVGKLTNRASYRYTPEQAAKVLGALAGEYNAVKAAFESTGKKAEQGFTL